MNDCKKCRKRAECTKSVLGKGPLAKPSCEPEAHGLDTKRKVYKGKQVILDYAHSVERFTSTDIAELTGFAKTHVSDMLYRLTQDGWLEREPAHCEGHHTLRYEYWLSESTHG